MWISASAALLDNIFPTIMQEFYKFIPFEKGYRFSLEDPDGNAKRDEMGVFLNPGTPEQQLMVMGTYSVIDIKTKLETITVYTADKDGYIARYVIERKFKIRKLSSDCLKSGCG
ncbi:uncharacterized protein LOC119634502 [Glossina fuscipes]|uniref:Uncharacterized protein LOC119634502 n=1 Tax=Glossina fuscipes TaxID=7396 RepID=A0A8U0WHR0_9MUSC|nr:uncharacterized protein LOC119634502 [Glossina fuscipes]